MYFLYQQQTILNHYIPDQKVSFILRLRNMGKKNSSVEFVQGRARWTSAGSTEVNRLSGQVHGVNILAYAKCSFKGLKLLY